MFFREEVATYMIQYVTVIHIQNVKCTTVNIKGIARLRLSTKFYYFKQENNSFFMPGLWRRAEFSIDFFESVTVD